jgi:hypothetical protein
MPRSSTVLALAVSAAAAAGCVQSPGIGGPCGTGRFATGGEPCRQQFYFPSGLAVDPDGDLLYVTNSNADLRYSGGSISAVDVAFFDCALSFACAGYPATLDAIPADDFLHRCGESLDDFRARCGGYADALVASVKHYDATQGTGCRADLLDPRVLECDEEPFIVDAGRIGNFAGSIRVQSITTATCPAAGSNRRRVWVPVRGDPSITFAYVDKPCPAPQVSGALIHCPDASGKDISGDRQAGIPIDCTNQRITVHDFQNPAAPGSQCSVDNSQCVQIPAEPFGMSLDEGLLPDGHTKYERLVVSHLAGGEVTVIDAANPNPISTPDDPPKQAVVLDSRGGFFPLDPSGRAGAFSVAPRPSRPGDPLESLKYWYLTSKLNATVALFRIAEVGLILPAGSFSVRTGPGGNTGGPFSVGSDERDFVFDPCTPDSPGCRGFFLDNFPPSLFTVDTRIDPTGQPAGVPRNEVVDIVDVCQTPSHLALRQFVTPGPEGNAPQTRVYVVCFGSSQIAVVDPDLGQVTDTILLGRGPNDIAFNFGPGIREPPGHRYRAYVTEYVDMNVAVVDLVPGSPTENRVIGRIGLTQPPPQQMVQ